MKNYLVVLQPQRKEIIFFFERKKKNHSLLFGIRSLVLLYHFSSFLPEVMMASYLIMNTSKSVEDHTGLAVTLSPWEQRAPDIKRDIPPDTGQVPRRPCGSWASAAFCRLSGQFKHVITLMWLYTS